MLSGRVFPVTKAFNPIKIIHKREYDRFHEHRLVGAALE